MAIQDLFTPDEWAALREAPFYAGMAAASAGSSGLFGTLGELFTAGKVIQEGRGNGSELIRQLASREEIEAANDGLQQALKGRSDSITSSSAWLADQAVMRMQNALSALRAKSPGEAAGYGAWIQEIARKVAESSKEGGFLGFGGERVSERERAFLERLRGAIG
jgi:hypothetical protein